MKPVKSFVFLLAVGIVALGTGCAYFKGEEPVKKVTPGVVSDVNTADQKKVLAIADSYAEGVLNAINNEDVVLFQKNFFKKEKFPPEKFKLIAEDFKRTKGVIKSRELMGSLKKPPLKQFVWKIVCELPNPKKAEDGKETLQIEVLFHMLLGDVDGKYYIAGVSFQ